MVAAVLVAALAAADPLPRRWLGVTLGERVDAVIQRYGDPYPGSAYENDTRRTLAYLVDHGKGEVTFDTRYGRVTRIYLRQNPVRPTEDTLPDKIRDPFGVALGDLATGLEAKHPTAQHASPIFYSAQSMYYADAEARWDYDTFGGRIITIEGSLAHDRSAAAQRGEISHPPR